MRHVQWHGWHMMDGVFPVFMFISGLSWPFSLAKQRAHGVTDGQLWAKIGKRVLTLFLLGLVCEGVLRIDRGWTFPFRVIGMNSLLFFLVQRFSGVNLMDAPAHALFDGVVKLCPESLGKVVFSAGYVAVCWFFLWFLYRKDAFLKA